MVLDLAVPEGLLSRPVGAFGRTIGGTKEMLEYKVKMVNAMSKNCSACCPNHGSSSAPSPDSTGRNVSPKTANCAIP